MGGGPRTYPGGVSKWQWKRMQAKKSKQLLKARLLRERQVYEMRKRAELKAAVAELERPWEVVEKAPVLFSVAADEQVKTLADRFQRPGGFDMWSERDGPEILRGRNGVRSERFFPRGVVHSVKPYEVVRSEGEGGGGRRRRRRKDEESGDDLGVIDVEGTRCVKEEGVRWNADENEGRDDGGKVVVFGGGGRGGGRHWNRSGGGLRENSRERVTLRPSSPVSKSLSSYNGGSRSRVKDLGRNK